MSAKMDMLAILDEIALFGFDPNYIGHANASAIDRLDRARKAIAELIAADKEYDEANENFANAKAGSVAQRMSRFSAAERRRASALAGASQ